jgi:hypothetical protein
VTGRPDQIAVDRFDVANASFWLDQVAGWLADPDHADRFASDLWPGFTDTGPPLTVIVGRTAAALRTTLRDTDDPGVSR